MICVLLVIKILSDGTVKVVKSVREIGIELFRNASKKQKMEGAILKIKNALKTITLEIYASN